MDVEGIALTNAAREAVEANASSAPARKDRPLNEPAKEDRRGASPEAAKTESRTNGPATEGRVDSRDSSRNEPGAERSENPLLQNLFRSSRLKLDFRLDEETQRVVISVIDPETQETVRQVPPEEILRLAEQLDSVRGGLVRSTV